MQLNARFCGAVRIITFLNLLGMLESGAPYLNELSEWMPPGRPGSAEARIEARQYALDLIGERERRPRDDFVSVLVQAQVMGGDLTPEKRLNIVQQVLTVGLDTVINTMSFAMTHFARNLALQRELREGGGPHAGAVDEITRRFGTSNLAPIARQDCKLADVRVARGTRSSASIRSPASTSAPIRSDDVRSAPPGGAPHELRERTAHLSRRAPGAVRAAHLP